MSASRMSSANLSWPVAIRRASVVAPMSSTRRTESARLSAVSDPF